MRPQGRCEETEAEEVRAANENLPPGRSALQARLVRSKARSRPE